MKDLLNLNRQLPPPVSEKYFLLAV